MSHMHPCKTKPGQQTYLVPKTAGRTTTISPFTTTPSQQTTADSSQSNVKPPPPADFIPTTTMNEPLDESWQIGEVISYDDLGPITPASSEGHTKKLTFLDNRSKYLFAYPAQTCTEKIFLYYLERISRFFTTRGYKPRILRSSDYCFIFRSN